MSSGLVYYALDATRTRQYVKIGYSTALGARMIALRQVTASAQTPLVLALEEGSVATERQRHHQFGSLRSHGEWFSYEDELRKFLADMEHPVAYLFDRPHLWVYAASWGPFSPPFSQQRVPGEGSPIPEDETPPIYEPVKF